MPASHTDGKIRLMKKFGSKKSGYKLLGWGLAITAVPFSLILVDMALRGGGNADPGVSLYGLVFLPAGPILAFIGLYIIFTSESKSK